MTKTENYELAKPEMNDYADVDVLNGNADLLDAALKALEDHKVNKAGDTMTGDLTVQKSYPRVRLAPTADGSNSIVMDAINQAMLQSRNAASDANRRGLLVRNSAKSAGIAGALVLMDVVDGAYTYYDVLHAGNIEANKLARIATGSYIGTTGSDEEGSVTLNFDFEPKMVVVVGSCYFDLGTVFVRPQNPNNGIGHVSSSSYVPHTAVEWGDKSITYSGYDDASYNQTGGTYYYAAFG